MSTDPATLFERVNAIGAQVDRLLEGNRTSWGTCDQVRLLLVNSPTDFWIAWWSPWPERDPRAMHVLHVTKIGKPRADGWPPIFAGPTALWEFSPPDDEFAAGIRDYHRHMATNPEHYAELERNAMAAAMNLLPGAD
jgi:hypothetical protein